jgi:hypothetical protein
MNHRIVFPLFELAIALALVGGVAALVRWWL